MLMNKLHEKKNKLKVLNTRKCVGALGTRPLSKNQTAESFGKKLKTAKKNSGGGSADDAVCCPQSTSSI